MNYTLTGKGQSAIFTLEKYGMGNFFAFRWLRAPLIHSRNETTTIVFPIVQFFIAQASK